MKGYLLPWNQNVNFSNSDEFVGLKKTQMKVLK